MPNSGDERYFPCRTSWLYFNLCSRRIKRGSKRMVTAEVECQGGRRHSCFIEVSITIHLHQHPVSLTIHLCSNQRSIGPLFSTTMVKDWNRPRPRPRHVLRVLPLVAVSSIVPYKPFVVLVAVLFHQQAFEFAPSHACWGSLGIWCIASSLPNIVAFPDRSSRSMQQAVQRGTSWTSKPPNKALPFHEPWCTNL